jgi:hypothetical protein
MQDFMGTPARRVLVTFHKLETSMSDTQEENVLDAESHYQGYKDCQEDMMPVFAEIARLRLATDEGSLAKRADRMWQIARQMLGDPVTGAKLFLGAPQPLNAAALSRPLRPDEPAISSHQSKSPNSTDVGSARSGS